LSDDDKNYRAGDAASSSFDESDENKPMDTTIVSIRNDVENGTLIR
jgi:hypothetical protein